MSRFYAMLMDQRLADAEKSSNHVGFEDFTGHHGEVPFIEVGSSTSESHESDLRIAPVSDPGTGNGLFSVTFRAFDMPLATGSARSLSKDLIVGHDPNHSISREYRSLAEEIQDQLHTSGPAVIALCGAGSGSGVTTVLLNLALTWCQKVDCRVAVIEANPTRPAFSARLGITAEPGVGDVLSGAESFSGAVKRVPDTSLLALPLGRPTHGLVGLGDFLTTLRHRFDWVLVDIGTELLLEPDVGLNQVADGCYMVVRDTLAQDHRLDEVRNRLTRAGVPMRGMVMTHAGQE